MIEVNIKYKFNYQNTFASCPIANPSVLKLLKGENCYKEFILKVLNFIIHKGTRNQIKTSLLNS